MAGKYATTEAKLHLATSVGASIVIFGVLFKILHLGGIYSNIIIGVGLGVEAILFLLIGLYPPRPDVQWQKVYPQLREGGKPTPDGVIPDLNNGNVSSGTSEQLNKLFADAKIEPSLIENLGIGLKNFSDKIAAISHVADASLATNEFTEKVKNTTSKLANLDGAFDAASNQLYELSNSGNDTRAYYEQVNNLAKNLSALNAVYELELQDSGTHLKSMNNFYQNLSLTIDNFNDSIDNSKQFKEEVAKLAKNLASLNAIYGNMLSAMNQPRA